MGDAEMRGHPATCNLDGRWSAQTEWLMRHFDTHRLDLNEAWAGTYQSWECPACGRSKLEIARVTEDGVLLCRLTEHHDHLSDYLKRLCREADIPGSLREGYGRGPIRAAAHTLIERFSRTLICEDCNNADAEMKKMIGSSIDRHFSFSPREIRMFVRPCENRKHEVDCEAGHAAWQEVKTDFEDRVAFAKVLAERIGAGRHDVEDTPGRSGRELQISEILVRLAFADRPPNSLLNNLGTALRDRSRSNGGNRSNSVRRAARAPRVPTAEDYAALNACYADQSSWIAAGEDWRCDICARSKFETVRIGNKGKWTASVHQLTRYTESVDPSALRYRTRRRSQILIGAHYRFDLCKDCRQIVIDGGKLLNRVEAGCLRPEDLRTLIGTPIAHRPHVVESDALRMMVSANAPWIDAIGDYEAHRNEVTDVSIDVCKGVRLGLIRSEAKSRAFAVRMNREVGAWTRDRFDWLLSEADRISGLDAKMQRRLES